MSKFKKFSLLFSLFLVVILLNGCGTLTRTKTMNAFAPNKVEMILLLGDMQYLGETEISVSYRTYLGGIFSSIDKINGEDYVSSNVKITKLDNSLFGDSRLEKATYKVVDEYPAADYYQVVYKRKVVERLFLGTEVVYTARIKAYSFNHNKN